MPINLDTQVLEDTQSVIQAADNLLAEGNHLSEIQQSCIRIARHSAYSFTKFYAYYLNEFLSSEYAEIIHGHAVTVSEMLLAWMSPMNASEVIAENGFDLWSDTERDIFRHMQELIVVIHNRLDEARQTLLRQLD